MTQANDITYLLEARGVSKRYGSTIAVDDVSLGVREGDVIGLVGSNGAGKSSLIKMLSGSSEPTTGRIFLDGVEVKWRGPGDALLNGVAMISQEGALVPTLSASANLELGRESSKLGFLARDRERDLKRDQIMSELGFQLELSTPVMALSAAERKQTEIVRALMQEARVVILDEPTAALGKRESQALLRSIEQLSRRGVVVFFVSHFLEEVLAVSTRVVVMRDGRLVAEHRPATTSARALVADMTDVRAEPQEREPMVRSVTATKKAVPLLRARSVVVAGGPGPIDLTIDRGEVVGLVGMVGSGRSELAEALFGARRMVSGSVEVDGRKVPLRTPRQAMEQGIALLAEDRARQGLIHSRPILDNLRLASWALLRRPLSVIRRSDAVRAHEMIRRMDVRPDRITKEAGTLSGGNQQKVLVGRWLGIAPRLLVADEPTRGVDVVAKAAIHEAIRGHLDDSRAAFVISSEFEELAELCDRVLVLRNGRIVAEMMRPFDIEAMTREAFLGSTPEDEIV